MPLAVLVGHPRPGSRTHGTAVRAGCLLREALRADGLAISDPGVIDLAELGPGLLEQGGPGPAARAALAACQGSLVVMATPTFRGAYSGLLKLFLDLLPRHALASTVVVPLMTAGIPAHRRAVNTSLLPVLLELGARVPAVGISVLEAELPRFDDVFRSWWAEHGATVRCAVPDRATGLESRVASC